MVKLLIIGLATIAVALAVPGPSGSLRGSEFRRRKKVEVENDGAENRASNVGAEKSGTALDLHEVYNYGTEGSIASSNQKIIDKDAKIASVPKLRTTYRGSIKFRREGNSVSKINDGGDSELKLNVARSQSRGANSRYKSGSWMESDFGNKGSFIVEDKLVQDATGGFAGKLSEAVQNRVSDRLDDGNVINDASENRAGLVNSYINERQKNVGERYESGDIKTRSRISNRGNMKYHVRTTDTDQGWKFRNNANAKQRTEYSYSDSNSRNEYVGSDLVSKEDKYLNLYDKTLTLSSHHKENNDGAEVGINFDKSHKESESSTISVLDNDNADSSRRVSTPINEEGIVKVNDEAEYSYFDKANYAIGSGVQNRGSLKNGENKLGNARTTDFVEETSIGIGHKDEINTSDHLSEKGSVVFKTKANADPGTYVNTFQSMNKDGTEVGSLSNANNLAYNDKAYNGVGGGFQNRNRFKVGEITKNTVVQDKVKGGLTSLGSNAGLNTNQKQDNAGVETSESVDHKHEMNISNYYDQRGSINFKAEANSDSGRYLNSFQSINSDDADDVSLSSAQRDSHTDKVNYTDVSRIQKNGSLNVGEAIIDAKSTVFQNKVESGTVANFKNKDGLNLYDILPDSESAGVAVETSRGVDHKDTIFTSSHFSHRGSDDFKTEANSDYGKYLNSFQSLNKDGYKNGSLSSVVSHTDKANYAMGNGFRNRDSDKVGGVITDTKTTVLQDIVKNGALTNFKTKNDFNTNYEPDNAGATGVVEETSSEVDRKDEINTGDNTNIDGHITQRGSVVFKTETNLDSGGYVNSFERKSFSSAKTNNTVEGEIGGHKVAEVITKTKNTVPQNKVENRNLANFESNAGLNFNKTLGNATAAGVAVETSRDIGHKHTIDIGGHLTQRGSAVYKSKTNSDSDRHIHSLELINKDETESESFSSAKTNPTVESGIQEIRGPKIGEVITNTKSTVLQDKVKNANVANFESKDGLHLSEHLGNPATAGVIVETSSDVIHKDNINIGGQLTQRGSVVFKTEANSDSDRKINSFEAINKDENKSFSNAKTNSTVESGTQKNGGLKVGEVITNAKSTAPQDVVESGTLANFENKDVLISKDKLGNAAAASVVLKTSSDVGYKNSINLGGPLTHRGSAVLKTKSNLDSGGYLSSFHSVSKDGNEKGSLSSANRDSHSETINNTFKNGNLEAEGVTTNTKSTVFTSSDVDHKNVINTGGHLTQRGSALLKTESNSDSGGYLSSFQSVIEDGDEKGSLTSAIRDSYSETINKTFENGNQKNGNLKTGGVTTNIKNTVLQDKVESGTAVNSESKDGLYLNHKLGNSAAEGFVAETSTEVSHKDNVNIGGYLTHRGSVVFKTEINPDSDRYINSFDAINKDDTENESFSSAKTNSTFERGTQNIGGLKVGEVITDTESTVLQKKVGNGNVPNFKGEGSLKLNENLGNTVAAGVVVDTSSDVGYKHNINTGGHITQRGSAVFKTESNSDSEGYLSSFQSVIKNGVKKGNISSANRDSYSEKINNTFENGIHKNGNFKASGVTTNTKSTVLQANFKGDGSLNLNENLGNAETAGVVVETSSDVGYKNSINPGGHLTHRGSAVFKAESNSDSGGYLSSFQSVIKDGNEKGSLSSANRDSYSEPNNNTFETGNLEAEEVTTNTKSTVLQDKVKNANVANFESKDGLYLNHKFGIIAAEGDVVETSSDVSHKDNMNIGGHSIQRGSVVFPTKANPDSERYINSFKVINKGDAGSKSSSSAKTNSTFESESQIIRDLNVGDVITNVKSTALQDKVKSGTVANFENKDVLILKDKLGNAAAASVVVKASSDVSPKNKINTGGHLTQRGSTVFKTKSNLDPERYVNSFEAINKDDTESESFISAKTNYAVDSGTQKIGGLNVGEVITDAQSTVLQNKFENGNVANFKGEGSLNLNENLGNAVAAGVVVETSSDVGYKNNINTGGHITQKGTAVFKTETNSDSGGYLSSFQSVIKDGDEKGSISSANRDSYSEKIINTFENGIHKNGNFKASGVTTNTKTTVLQDKVESTTVANSENKNGLYFNHKLGNTAAEGVAVEISSGVSHKDNVNIGGHSTQRGSVVFKTEANSDSKRYINSLKAINKDDTESKRFNSAKTNYTVESGTQNIGGLKVGEVITDAKTTAPQDKIESGTETNFENKDVLILKDKLGNALAAGVVVETSGDVGHKDNINFGGQLNQRGSVVFKTETNSDPERYVNSFEAINKDDTESESFSSAKTNYTVDNRTQKIGGLKVGEVITDTESTVLQNKVENGNVDNFKGKGSLNLNENLGKAVPAGVVVKTSSDVGHKNNISIKGHSTQRGSVVFKTESYSNSGGYLSSFQSVISDGDEKGSLSNAHRDSNSEKSNQTLENGIQKNENSKAGGVTTNTKSTFLQDKLESGTVANFESEDGLYLNDKFGDTAAEGVVVKTSTEVSHKGNINIGGPSTQRVSSVFNTEANSDLGIPVNFFKSITKDGTEVANLSSTNRNVNNEKPDYTIETGIQKNGSFNIGGVTTNAKSTDLQDKVESGTVAYFESKGGLYLSNKLGNEAAAGVIAKTNSNGGDKGDINFGGHLAQRGSVVFNRLSIIKNATESGSLGSANKDTYGKTNNTVENGIQENGSLKVGVVMTDTKSTVLQDKVESVVVPDFENKKPLSVINELGDEVVYKGSSEISRNEKITPEDSSYFNAEIGTDKAGEIIVPKFKQTPENVDITHKNIVSETKKNDFKSKKSSVSETNPAVTPLSFNGNTYTRNSTAIRTDVSLKFVDSEDKFGTNLARFKDDNKTSFKHVPEWKISSINLSSSAKDNTNYQVKIVNVDDNKTDSFTPNILSDSIASNISVQVDSKLNPNVNKKVDVQVPSDDEFVSKNAETSVNVDHENNVNCSSDIAGKVGYNIINIILSTGENLPDQISVYRTKNDHKDATDNKIESNSDFIKGKGYVTKLGDIVNGSSSILLHKADISDIVKDSTLAKHKCNNTSKTINIFL